MYSIKNIFVVLMIVTGLLTFSAHLQAITGHKANITDRGLIQMPFVSTLAVDKDNLSDNVAFSNKGNRDNTIPLCLSDELAYCNTDNNAPLSFPEDFFRNDTNLPDAWYNSKADIQMLCFSDTSISNSSDKVLNKQPDKPRLMIKSHLTNATYKKLADYGDFSWEITGIRVADPQFVIDVKEFDHKSRLIKSYAIKTKEFKFSGVSIFKDVKDKEGYFQWQVREITTGLASEMFYFSINPCDIYLKISNVNITCSGTDGTQIQYQICFSSTYRSTTGSLTYLSSGSGFTAWDQVGNPLTPISPLSLYEQPGTPLNTYSYCFDILVTTATTQIGFGLQGDDLDPTPIICRPGVSYQIDSLPACRCNACDTIQVDIPWDTITILNSELLLETPIIVTPGAVRTVKAQLINFRFQPEDDDCIPCNRNSSDWGNFTGGTTNDVDFLTDGILNFGHEIAWSSTHLYSSNTNGIFQMEISMPPLVKCCKAEIKFCIRYIIQFDNCIVCEKVICYSYILTTN